MAHRDIKLGNFLLDADLNALLTDFSFVCLATERTKDKLMKNTACETADYMASEINESPYDAKG